MKHPGEGGLGEFQEVQREVCRYWKRGGCSKRDNCEFAHPVKEVQQCTNGPQCRYLARGITGAMSLGQLERGVSLSGGSHYFYFCSIF